MIAENDYLQTIFRTGSYSIKKTFVFERADTLEEYLLFFNTYIRYKKDDEAFSALTEREKNVNPSLFY